MGSAQRPPRIPIGIPGGADRIASEDFAFRSREVRREIHEHIVRGGIANEGMIDDDQIVAIDVLLDRGFAEFAKCAAIPVRSRHSGEKLLYSRAPATSGA